MTTIMDRVLGRQPMNQQLGQLENPQIPISSTAILDALHVPYLTSAQVFVTEKKALAMPAVWRSVTLIAGAAAGMPLAPYKQADPNGDGVLVPQIVSTGQAAQLLQNPHPDMTPFEFWELIYCHMLLWGNAYVQKLRNQLGVVVELWPIHPSKVKVGRSSIDQAKVYTVDGYDHPLSDDEILHFPGFGYDGVAGLSAIAAARQGIGLALAAEDFGARLFGSGALSSGIITTEQKLTQDKADTLRERWKQRNSGMQNAHNIAVLDSGAKFEKLTIAPEDAQFLQSRTFQVEEIARMFGVPPHMLMSMEKTTSWGTGIEQQSITFVTFTLGPWLTRVEQRVTKMIKPQAVYAKYDTRGLLRGDSVQRSAYYTAMRNIGVLNANEIRAMEGLPPIDGGDVYITQLNMAPLQSGETDPSKEPANAA